MRKGGKVTVVHIYFPFIHFFVASPFSLSPHHPEGERMTNGDTKPLFLSEEFVEKFFEVFFRDDGMII